MLSSLLPALAMIFAASKASAPTVAESLARKEQVLVVPGYRAAYLRAGRGRPIVLLHGGGTWAYSWRRNFDALAKTHDVIAIDMIGHGYTERLPGRPARYDLAETTAFIDAVLTGLTVPRATLVGNSWGGGWALAYAQAHPERVERLILIGSAGLPRRERMEWELMRWPLVGEVMTWLMGRNDVADGLRSAVYDGRTVTQEDIDAVWTPLQRSEVRRAQVEMMRRLDWKVTAAGLGKLRSPVLVLTGEADQYVSVAASRALCNAIAGARFAVIPRAGHVAQEDRPDLINPLIAAFTDGADIDRLIPGPTTDEPNGPHPLTRENRRSPVFPY